MRKGLYIFQPNAAKSGEFSAFPQSVSKINLLTFLLRQCMTITTLKETNKKMVCVLPWPERYVPVLPYKKILAHCVASLNPGKITQN